MNASLSMIYELAGLGMISLVLVSSITALIRRAKPKKVPVRIDRNRIIRKY